MSGSPLIGSQGEAVSDLDPLIVPDDALIADRVPVHAVAERSVQPVLAFIVYLGDPWPTRATLEPRTCETLRNSRDGTSRIKVATERDVAKTGVNAPAFLRSAHDDARTARIPACRTSRFSTTYILAASCLTHAQPDRVHSESVRRHECP